jgi:hypothetical protein
MRHSAPAGGITSSPPVRAGGFCFAGSRRATVKKPGSFEVAKINMAPGRFGAGAFRRFGAHVIARRQAPVDYFTPGGGLGAAGSKRMGEAEKASKDMIPQGHPGPAGASSAGFFNFAKEWAECVKAGFCHEVRIDSIRQNGGT